jgi:hypothetical protein
MEQCLYVARCWQRAPAGVAAQALALGALTGTTLCNTAYSGGLGPQVLHTDRLAACQDIKWHLGRARLNESLPVAK